MPVETALTRALGLTRPIVQAPMAGGGDTPALVAAVSEAGGLGSIGAAYLPLEGIAAAARAVRAQTARPFAINLFAPTPPPDPDVDAAPVLARVAPFFAELGLPAPAAPVAAPDDFDARFAAALDTGAAVLSFTFGRLPPAAMAAARERGVILAGTATTVAEAVALAADGCDLVIAQGSEAGGHRGTFLGDPSRGPGAGTGAGMVGTLALVPQIADAVSIPVIASGGIMDGRGIVAALALGAGAVQMGTAFLACDEAGVPDAYKAAIVAAAAEDTRLTRAFSGRAARGIANRFMDAVDADPGAILPFPLQNGLTRPMRAAAAREGRADFLSLWCGQGSGLARRGPAAVLLARLDAETDAAMARLPATVRRVGD